MKKLTFFLFVLLIPSLLFASASRDFDEASDFLELLPPNPSTGDGGFAAWVAGDEAGADFARVISNRLGTTTHGMIMGKRSGADQEKLTCTVAMGAAFRGSGSSTASFNDAVWRFVFCDFLDGTTAHVRMYINNMETADNSTSGNFGAHNIGDPDMEIGAEELTGGGSKSQFWDGRISSYQFYDGNTQAWLRSQLMFLPGSYHLTTWLPIWGGSPEPELSGNDDDATVTGTTSSSDGPPIAYGGLLPL